MIKLSRQLNEATSLGLKNGIEELLAEIFSSNFQKNDLLAIAADQGVLRRPLHCTSIGKIVLSNLPEVELNLYFEIKKLERLTPKTIIDPKVLQEQLIKIRTEGIATDDEEFSVGVRSVGTAIRDADGEVVGGIGVVAPSTRLTFARMKQVVPDIRKYAAEISKGLGYKDQVPSR